MKKSCFFILLLLFLNTSITAQYAHVHDFTTTASQNGTSPYASLAISCDGAVIYGTTYTGGGNDFGIIYKVNTDGSNFTKLHDFSGGADGRWPYSTIIESCGILYGMTYSGGANNKGNVYKIDTSGAGFTVLLDFNGTNGGGTSTGLTISGNILYGTTNSGGSSNMGVVFKINTDGTGYTKLLDFTGVNGNNPYTQPLALSGNVLYGMTNFGGANSKGCIYSINTDGTGYTKLLDFDGNTGTQNGSRPGGQVIESGGVLYGMASDGGTNDKGVIFKINTNGSGYTKLYDFSGNPDGRGPHGNLALSGNVLYGMTNYGGTSDVGMLFKINTDGTGYTKLQDLALSGTGGDGYGTLSIVGTKLYGTVNAGGIANGTGVLFSYTDPTLPPFSAQNCCGLKVIANDTTICKGDCATITAIGSSGTLPYTYNWQPGGLNTPTINVCPVSTTTYTITLTDAVGNTATDTARVTVIDPGVATFNYVGSPYCQNSTNPLPTYSGGGVAGIFSSTAGLTFVSTVTGEINLAASTPGTYTVINIVASLAPCPPDTAITSITIMATPVATFNYSAPYCQTAANAFPTFSGGVAGTFSSTAGLVFVNTNTGEINIAASTPGTYIVKNVVLSSAPCSADSATATITINSKPTASISGDTIICIGSSITLTAAGGGTYLWSTNETTDSIIVNPLDTTTYFVVADNGTCVDTATINVIVNSTFANTNPDTTVCPGTPIQLQSSGGGNYSWLPTIGLSCDGCQNPIAIAEDNIRYCVTVTSVDGCIDSACVDIEIFCNYFYIPNAFTPNNNGLNEKFRPKVIGVHDYHFLIFDRWGEKIFETSDITEGWNGSYQGTECELGVYVYKIVFTEDEKNLSTGQVGKQRQYIGKVILLK